MNQGENKKTTMTILEFEEKLNTIYQTLFGNLLPANNHTAATYFDALYPYINTLPGKDYPFFLLQEDTGNTIEFIMNCRAGDLFMVNKNDLQTDSAPIPFIKIKEEWQYYDFSLSTLLLTEYVHWLSENADHKLALGFEGYAIYVPVKKHWDQFFNPFSYPNKIWTGKDIHSVIYIQNEHNNLTCIARDAYELELAGKLLTL